MNSEKLFALQEADKRGLLKGPQKEAYDEAVKRGLIGASEIKAEAEPEPESRQEKQNEGLFGDAVDSFQAGALSSFGGMFDFVGAEGMAKSLYDWSDEQQLTMSDKGKEALSKQFVVEDENGDIALGEGAKDLDTWILTMANVAGQFASTAIPGGAAAGAVAKAASLGGKASKAAKVAGMGATGGSAATGQGMEQARKEVESMPDDILGDSPMFIKTLREIHSSNPELSGAEKWDLAKKEISERVAQDVRTDPKVLIANFGASAIGDPIIGKALVGARLAKSGALKSSLAGFATEGATEAVQAGTQQYGINEALQPLDNRDAMDGVVTAGLNEGLAGAGFGGIAGGIGGVANRGNAKPEDQPSSILPDDEITPRIDENKSVQLPETVIDEIAAPARSEAASKFQSASSDIVSNGVDQLVGTGFTKEQAIEAVKAYQYQAAIKKGLSEREASLVVAQTMKDKFDIDDPILAMPEPAQEQTIPDDNVTPKFEDNTTSKVDYDAPTAARQAGFDQTAKAAGQYGDMLTSPAQQSLKALDEGNNAPTVDERVKAAAFDKSPTPEDRFSPIKYQHEGELLSPEAQRAQGIDNPPIDGQIVPEQGKLPTTEQTKNREMREQAQADLESQPKGIEQKDIIFGEDGRPQQRAAEQVKQAGKNSQNLLPQKDIIFAGNESGVNVAKSGEPFKTKRDALLSKEARAARRAGKKTKAVSFDDGFGWTAKGDSQSSAPNTGADIGADNKQTDATLTDEGTIPQSNETIDETKTQPTANLAGDPIDGEWTAFSQQSETKNIPRSEMPQIKAENRGAMVNFMNARDISHEQGEVPASSLKPTQQEFSPAKVKKAMEFEGGNRSILVSSDNYVLDGHHQWLAAREKGEPVKVIRLNAPIEQLVPLAKEMPSTETQDDAGKLTTTGNEETATTGKLNGDNGKQSEQKAAETAETGKLIEQEPATTEQANELPLILKTTKRKWLQSQAKEQGLKKGSPGFDVAMAKIEESYEPAIDKALAESSFETYQQFNDETPVSINRMAYDELRKEFGYDKAPPPETSTPTENKKPPKSGFSLPEQPAEPKSNVDADEVQFFSKSSKVKPAGVIKADAEKAADNFIKSLKGAAGIKVKVLNTAAEAEKLWKMNLAGSTVKGAYSNKSKTVYIIAENIESDADLKQTLAHETIAHGGLDTVIGADAKQEFLNRIKATKGRKAFLKLWKDVNTDYWDASPDVKAEEMFARFVENEPSKGELKYWWQALKRFIRAQLDKIGVAYREDDEVTAMRDMLESIVKGFKAQREPVQQQQSDLAYSQSDKKFSSTTNNDTNPAPSKISEAVKKVFNRESRFEKSSVPEWEALNAQLRETDKTAASKIKRELSRWFMPGGNLPETVKQATRGRDRDVAVHEFDVSMLVGKLNSAMKAAKLNPDKLTDEQWAKYHQFLIGKNDGQALTQSERDTLVLMREHIDGLTRDYVTSINNKLQQRLVESGSTDPKESARLEKMLGNIGKYLNRSYKAFDDPKWFEKIPTKIIDDARTYLMKQYKKDGATTEEAKQKAQVTMNEMVKTGTAYDSLGAFIAESKLGSKDLSTLIPRKDISPEIRALLGEYIDPRVNYAKSVSKMSAMIANDKLLSTIRDMGINNFIFEKDDRPPNATVQLAGEKSEVYAPLNGMWTTPEIKEAFEDAMGGERGEGWLDKAIQINGFIKYGKTVLSPTTAMRNVMSSYFFTVANGHFNQKYMKQAVAAFNAQVKEKVTDGESDYIKRLIKLGVLYDSANAGDIVKVMTDGKISQMLEGKSNTGFDGLNKLADKTTENLRWLTAKATGFYRFGDDFWKIVGFENEKAALIRTGMKEGEAETLAAERIQDTYPTYSRVGKAGAWLSRFPLAGTFVSFPAEIIRTTGNMMKLAASEIKSDNPKIRAMGAKRIVGMSLASGGMFALSALSAAMFGVTDDEEEALRDLAPEWQKNSTFVYAGRDSDNNLRYFDMSFLDPYAYWKRPIEAIMRDQPVDKAIASSLSDMVSPFLGADITASKILEVLSNKKSSGGQVYKENDTAIRKSTDIASHLALGLAPGFVNNAWRIGMAAGDVKRSTGKPYSLSDEMLALAGFRSSTFDPKVGLYYRTFDFNNAIAEARKELSGVLRDPNKVSDDEISAAKARAKTKQEQAFKQMARLIKAAQTGGANRRQVVQILLLAGISKRNIGFLLREQVPPVNLSDRSFESAVKRAQLIMDNESAREVRSRFNRIIKND